VSDFNLVVSYDYAQRPYFRINSIDFNETGTPKTATIHFEKPTAVKTALMLNGGTLDGEHLTVTSEAEHPDEPQVPYTEGTPIDQTHKPRAASTLMSNYIFVPSD
jgi:hypothetical protein